MNWKQVLIVICFGAIISIAIGTSCETSHRHGGGSDLTIHPKAIGVALFSLVTGVVLYVVAGYRRCPKCGERIRREAQICRFCKYEIPKKPRKEVVTPVVHSQQEIVSKEDQSKPVTSAKTTEEATPDNEMSVPRVRYQTEVSSGKVDISKIPTHRSNWKMVLGIWLFLFGCYRFGVSYHSTGEEVVTEVLYAVLRFVLEDPLVFLICLVGLFLIFLQLYERTEAWNIRKAYKPSGKRE